jgi:putative FmdB family regulatory protein
MPIYEYRCQGCGHTLEVIQRFSERPLRKCPECAGRLEKLISRAAFHLKGGGWFVNDYSKGKPSPAESEEKSKPSETPAPTPSSSPPSKG